MRVAIGSDHAGYELKEFLKQGLLDAGYTVMDEGADSEASVDYVDYALKVAKLVANGGVERGVLVCGTGIGMSIAANKVRGVRAALAYDLYTAIQSRKHVNANVLVLGGRVTGKGLAAEMLKNWLETPFEGGRHAGRVEKIRRLEDDCYGSPESKG